MDFFCSFWSCFVFSGFRRSPAPEHRAGRRKGTGNNVVRFPGKKGRPAPPPEEEPEEDGEEETVTRFPGTPPKSARPDGPEEEPPVAVDEDDAGDGDVPEDSGEPDDGEETPPEAESPKAFFSARLDALLNRPSVVEKLYALPDSAVLFQAGVNNDYEVSDGSLYTSYQTRTLTEEESALLLQAVRDDIAAGRLGRRFLLEDRERYQLCYYNDLTLSFYFPNTTDGPNTQPADVPSGSTLFEVTITLQTTATETIAALEELGLVDGAHPLLTHQEMMAAEQGLTPSALLLPDTRVAELTPAEAAG